MITEHFEHVKSLIRRKLNAYFWLLDLCS